MSVRQVVKFIWNTRHCAMPGLSYEMAVPFMFHFIKFKLQNVGKHKPDPSMCKWLPKVSFPSITSALENLWPTQWSPFHYVTTSFRCAVKMDNENGQRYATVSSEKRHSKAARPQTVCTNIGCRLLFSIALRKNWPELRDNCYFYILWATIFSWKIPPQSYV